MNLKKFITSRGPILALVVALLYGIFIFVIYYTGYHAMPTNMDKLPVTVVSSNQQNTKLAHQITKSLPFDTVKTGSDLTKAKKNLNNRQTYLVIHIPANFSRNVKANKPAKLNFYLNESNQTSVVSGMRSVANAIGSSVSQQVILKKGETMLTKEPLMKLQTQLQKQETLLKTKTAQEKQSIQAAPASSRAQLAAKLQQETISAKAKINNAATEGQKQIQQKATTAYAPVKNSVNVKIHTTNKVSTGLNNSMAPFISNLAIYLGSLIGALLLYGTFVKFAKLVGKYRSFALMEMAMVIIAALGALIVSATIIGMMGLAWSKLWTLWLIHGLILFGSYNFNEMLILAIGQIGTALNIFLTMIQVVAGAGMVPVATMNEFFKISHYISPMFYGIRADFNTMFGGPAIIGAMTGLEILTIAVLLVNLLIVALRKRQPMLQFEQLS
ncbi:YhgE/Pip domain-containing protein [Lentilactobacillus parakefiri]|uniref:ABC-2 family transporter protein n=1 Tax=Lentilactobacillus parakefiri TaxID=152332 RepID=A0A224V8H3_9LACO|nr:ABC transporter permease [Lentilactobacillus parakefiri]KRL64200.1 hypothetical protein FD08_GL002486 [Lentilactobacillus parakefiri DSM 10551]PAK99843.1 hypothetical protein B8W96_09590 [Lentilactobacillus parakefiri]TDG95137.1 hypothetical protein C5L28_002178 [Lentilactobacillus parakefiri]GAW71035.1 ABC-2 family transporter protein [Lentilactobacillus parakefiri]